MEKYIFLFLFVYFIHGTSAINYYYMDNYCDSSINVGFYDQIRLKLTSSYHYQPNYKCQVTLKTDLGDRMMVYFKDLDTENTCSNDWVELDDGQSRSDPYITGGKKCGHSTPTSVYTTSGRYMTVYFQSDSSVQGKGFDMVITSFHTGYCYSWEYSCDNGRCISNGLQCNGYNPCGDHSDCSLSAGAIAGIVIGCIVFTTVVVIVSVAVRRRRGVIVHQQTAMPAVSTVHTTAVVGGYAYNQPTPQSYAPPPYPGTTVAPPQYSGTVGVATVQY